MPDAASRLQSFAEELLGVRLPVRIRAWDGSEAGPPGAPALVVRNRRALRRLLWKPGELGLARAWVAGDLDIEGDFMPPSIWCPGWSGTAGRAPESLRGAARTRGARRGARAPEDGRAARPALPAP